MGETPLRVHQVKRKLLNSDKGDEIGGPGQLVRPCLLRSRQEGLQVNNCQAVLGSVDKQTHGIAADHAGEECEAVGIAGIPPR